MQMEQAGKSSERQSTWLLSPSPASSLLRCRLHAGLCQVPPAWHGEPITGSGEQG